MKGEQLTVSPLSSFFDDVIGEELEERWSWGEITSLQGKCHCILVRQAEAETAHPTETLQEGTTWRQSGWFRTMVFNSMILVSPPQASEHWELSIFGFSSGCVGGSFDISQYSITYETASEQRTIYDNIAMWRSPGSERFGLTRTSQPPALLQINAGNPELLLLPRKEFCRFLKRLLPACPHDSIHF